MPLTDTKIKNAKAQEKVYRLYDKRGWVRGKPKFDQRFVAWVEDCRREQDA